MMKPFLRKRLVWLLLVYGTVVMLILYPAFHERFGFKVALWDCLPPTLGLIFLFITSGKTARHFIYLYFRQPQRASYDVLCPSLVFYSARY